MARGGISPTGAIGSGGDFTFGGVSVPPMAGRGHEALGGKGGGSGGGRHPFKGEQQKQGKRGGVRGRCPHGGGRRKERGAGVAVGGAGREAPA
jgi:hypothetical protein